MSFDKSHHIPKTLFSMAQFDNPWAESGKINFTKIYSFYATLRRHPRKGWLSWSQEPTPADFAKAFPVVPTKLAELQTPPKESNVKCVWVGHAALYIQQEGFSFLTDPTFNDYVGPIKFMCPQRIVPPPFTIDDPEFTQLDFVVISHNHHDHLDPFSVNALYKKFGDRLKWYVPLGVKKWFTDMGINNCVELDWWEESVHTNEENPGKSLRIVFTPTQHWSGRYGIDSRSTLWGSWCMIGEITRTWFGGDTGYCPVFKEIGEKYGPFDLCAIPVGAYHPREFLSPQHVSPIEALIMHEELRSKVSIGIHHGTFNLTGEPMDEPSYIIHTRKALTDMKGTDFINPYHGEIVEIEEGKVINSPQMHPTEIANESFLKFPTTI